ncbi:hypothetical protein PENSPDRAFT_737871 [Peniophora sp. CONT]|nr:hypothetical protein PENSPDRAFT_737871 [Peniophora sp. CONT]
MSIPLLSLPQRPTAPFQDDPLVMALYTRDMMGCLFAGKKQDSFTAAFFTTHSHPDFSVAINLVPHAGNKVLGLAHRNALEWYMLGLVAMPFCGHPRCTKQKSWTERGHHFMMRHILKFHFPEFANASPELKDEVCRPYVDYALIQDFAQSREQWSQIQKGNVVGARPTRSWRCPDSWTERVAEVPLSPEAQQWKDAHPIKSDSQASPPTAQSLASGASSPGTSASPTVHGSEGLNDDVDMKSLFGEDTADFSSSPSTEGTPVLVQSNAPSPDQSGSNTPSDIGPELGSDMSAPPVSRLGSWLNGPTGQIIDPETGLPMSAERMFGVSMDMFRYKAELPLDDLFFVPATKPKGWRFPFPDDDDQPLSEPMDLTATRDDFHLDFNMNAPSG